MIKSADDETDRPALEVGAAIIEAMDKEFHDAPDRVLAIVGAAYLDSLLERLFRAVFVEDKKQADNLLAPTGALGSNGARYQLAYCLGLLEKKQRDDLRTIAKIRNAFAHRYNVPSFEHEDAKKLLAKLLHGKEFDAIINELVQDTRDPEQQKHFRQIGASGRSKFQDTVRNLFVDLLRKLDCVNRPDRSTWYRGNPHGRTSR